jgi:hypothetical protein
MSKRYLEAERFFRREGFTNFCLFLFSSLLELNMRAFWFVFKFLEAFDRKFIVLN